MGAPNEKMRTTEKWLEEKVKIRLMERGYNYNNNNNNTLHHSLRLFGISCWAFYYHNRFGWFRLFGSGLKWKDTSIHGLLFGERNGHSKGLQIGKWRIGVI
jgi:hypothetical protein